MSIKLIVAVDSNFGIGYKNDLLFKVPEDLKRFKKLTTGHFVVMGRKTFESLPRPLPERTNVVVTRKSHYSPENPSVLVVNDIQRCLNPYLNTGIQDKDMWIIGGAEIYRTFLPHADEVYMTMIHKEAEKVDTYFPFAEMLKEGFYTSGVESFFSENENCVCSYAIYRKS